MCSSDLVSAFREHLRGRPGGLFSVVADLSGEDFHEEQIPFLRGADREAIVQRRLAQRYRDTRLLNGEEERDPMQHQQRTGCGDSSPARMAAAQRYAAGDAEQKKRQRRESAARAEEA